MSITTPSTTAGVAPTGSNTALAALTRAIEQGGAVLSRFSLRADHSVYVLTNAQRSSTTILAGVAQPADFE